MAAISSISNGEALSSVRTKLNSVITEINLLDPTDWIDYSATSTIVGYSSYFTKQIRYRVIGKLVFVQFFLNGTSNSPSLTFTLPFNLSNTSEHSSYFRFYNNGAAGTTIPYLYIGVNNNQAQLFTTIASGGWTASGSKIVNGQFFYEIA